MESTVGRFAFKKAVSAHIDEFCSNIVKEHDLIIASLRHELQERKALAGGKEPSACTTAPMSNPPTESSADVEVHQDVAFDSEGSIVSLPQHVSFNLRTEWEHAFGQHDLHSSSSLRRMPSVLDEEVMLENYFLQGKGSNLNLMRRELGSGSGILKLSCLKVRNPSSRERLTWDVLGMVVLLYDLLLIPLQLGFDMPDSTAMDIISVAIMCYWALDVPASFCVGFYRPDGRLEMRAKPVAINYLRSWFALDVLIVGNDVMGYILDAIVGNSMKASGVVRSGKLMRGLRVLRTFRILRVAKLKRVIRSMQDRIDSEKLFLVLRIVRHMALVLAINHYTACGWHALGCNPPEGQIGWTRRFSERDSMLKRYLVSLQWALTQFTPGSSPIQPLNTVEFVFALVVLIFAMIIFSSFVSAITAAMSRLGTMAAQNAAQLWKLRKFLHENDISRQLSSRIYRFLELTTAFRPKVQAKDVELLKSLSEPLFHAIQLELYRPHFAVHPFFSLLAQSSPDVMSEICCSAVKTLSLSHGDILFRPGKEATSMYFVTRGLMRYVHAVSGHATTVDQEEWVSEAALWTPWVFRGRLRAIIDSEVISLDCNKFRSIMLSHPARMRFPKEYSRAFLRCLTECDLPDDGHGVSDLQHDLLDEEPMQEILNSTQSTMSTRSVDQSGSR